MAKPRIFVSSTYYDLKHIRRNLESFIDSLGFDSVLFESGDIPFRHDQPIDESCYSEISTCHMLVLIIGGRYGSPSSEGVTNASVDLDKIYDQYNSITKKEYLTARERDIPIFIFVDKNVLAEFNTFKSNRENKSIKYAHVDSVNVFLLLDEVLTQRRNNYIRGFENFEEVSTWLRDQWAGLFADFLSKKSQETTLANLSAQISDLNGVNKALKEYTETILQSVASEKSTKIISEQNRQITASRLKRFTNEPMIKYIEGTSDPKIRAEELFKPFLMSHNLDDFLSKSKLSKKYIDNFLTTHSDLANKDYRELRIRYLINPDNDLSIDHPPAIRPKENKKVATPQKKRSAPKKN